MYKSHQVIGYSDDLTIVNENEYELDYAIKRMVRVALRMVL